MGRYTIVLDDGDQLLSSTEVERDSLDDAVRENLRSATVLALLALEDGPGRRTAQLEVEDRATGEWKLCLVTVSLNVLAGHRPRH